MRYEVRRYAVRELQDLRAEFHKQHDQQFVVLNTLMLMKTLEIEIQQLEPLALPPGLQEEGDGRVQEPQRTSGEEEGNSEPKGCGVEEMGQSKLEVHVEKLVSVSGLLEESVARMANLIDAFTDVQHQMEEQNQKQLDGEKSSPHRQSHRRSSKKTYQDPAGQSERLPNPNARQGEEQLVMLEVLREIEKLSERQREREQETARVLTSCLELEARLTDRERSVERRERELEFREGSQSMNRRSGRGQETRSDGSRGRGARSSKLTYPRTHVATGLNESVTGLSPGGGGGSDICRVMSMPAPPLRMPPSGHADCISRAEERATGVSTRAQAGRAGRSFASLSNVEC